MPKNNFLLVDLNESKTKKLAETITSPTSRKILNYLVEKDDTEANIAKELGMPISTVHYHLQKLQEASLVIVEEFHYSEKGREVNHYKLANKYIIIAPRKVSGLKEKLKGILPVGAAIVGISAIIKLLTPNSGIFQSAAKISAPALAMEEAAIAGAPEMAMLARDVAQEAVVETSAFQPDLALGFLLGGTAALLIYILVSFVREKLQERN